MTYYHQQILQIRKDIYAKEYLYNQVIHAKLFIDNHYSDSIDLNDIAREAFFSKFHFIRLFKTIYGQTPYQHLKMVRIKNAKQLLQSGMPVTEVCFAVGFTSTSSFTSFFKELTGLTPSAFQKNKKRQAATLVPLKIIVA
jgi:AraC-like DNA-binding protein